MLEEDIDRIQVSDPSTDEDFFDEELEGDVISDTPEVIFTEEVVQISSGEALTSSETAEITNRTRTPVILLAGDQESGKTTLLASLFWCFQRGPFAEFSFCDSRTLMGLERRSWKSRTASMGSVPEIDRSKLATRRYLHLQLADLSSTITNLIFCDLPGELFEAVINRPAASKDIIELGRADHLAILIDGAKLRRLDLRLGARRNAWLLMRGLLDSKELGPSVPIELVFTKIDLFGGEPLSTESKVDPVLFASEEDTVAYIEEVKRSFMNEFVPKGINLRFFETAAQETSQKYELGHGIEPLIMKWVREFRIAEPLIERKVTESNSEREIDQFCEREMNTVND